MNVAIAYGPWDEAQFKRWLQWCAELGGNQNHSLTVLPFKGLTFNQSEAQGWKSVTVLRDGYGLESEWSGNGEQRCASGPNASWRQVAMHFAVNNLGPFLWMESDAIPLTSNWLDRIEGEYKQAGKRYMGANVNVEGIPQHLSGISVYPGYCGHTAINLMLPRHANIGGKNLEIAFDVAGAPDILPNAHFTRLIQHRFRAAPITSQDEFERIVDKEAVIYHSDKTGSTINLVRNKVFGHVTAERTIELAHAVAPKKPTNPEGAPKVYTYFSPAPDPKLVEEQKSILDVWQREWKKAGFEPVILTQYDARQEPMFDRWSDAFEKLPTVNPAFYEQAAWTRHIAMVAVGGGLLTDYDVIPNGFTAKDEPTVPHGDKPLLLCIDVPCAVYGSKTQYENAICAFISCPPATEKGQPHLSDMHACKALRFPSQDLCREYGTQGFEDAPLIHFSHASRHGRFRSEIMKQWLAGERIIKSKVADGAMIQNSMVMPLPTVEFSDGAGTLETLHKPPTFAGQARFHATELKKMATTVSRMIVIRNELRKAGVISGQRKARKKRKWPGL